MGETKSGDGPSVESVGPTMFSFTFNLVTKSLKSYVGLVNLSNTFV